MGSATTLARVARPPFPRSPLGVRDRLLPLDDFRFVANAPPCFARTIPDRVREGDLAVGSIFGVLGGRQPGRRTASPTTARRRGS